MLRLRSIGSIVARCACGVPPCGIDEEGERASYVASYPGVDWEPLCIGHAQRVARIHGLPFPPEEEVA